MWSPVKTAGLVSSQGSCHSPLAASLCAISNNLLALALCLDERHLLFHPTLSQNLLFNGSIFLQTVNLIYTICQYGTMHLVLRLLYAFILCKINPVAFRLIWIWLEEKLERHFFKFFFLSSGFWFSPEAIFRCPQCGANRLCPRPLQSSLGPSSTPWTHFYPWCRPGKDHQETNTTKS